MKLNKNTMLLKSYKDFKHFIQAIVTDLRY